MWTVLNAFNAGEISPAMRGRFDFDRYGLACARLKNFIVQPQGGASNRPGTRYIGDAGGECRLVPFSYSADNSYVLVFTDNGDYDPNYEGDDPKYLSPGLAYVVKGTGFVLDGDERYVIYTPYPSADLPLLRFSAQTGYTMILTHPDYPMQTLTCAGDADWALAPMRLAPAVDAPAACSAVFSGTPSTPFRTYKYAVTASVVALGESFASPEAQADVPVPWPSGETVAVSWSDVPGATSYHVYKNSYGEFGWIGSLAAGTRAGLFADDADPGRTAETKDLAGQAYAGPALSPHHMWAVGNSLAFAGDRRLVFSDSLDYQLASGANGDFTIDLWVGLHALPSSEAVLAEAAGAWRISVGTDGKAHFKILPAGGATVDATVALTAIPAGRFHYLRVVRDGLAGYFYLYTGVWTGPGSWSVTADSAAVGAVPIPATTSLSLGAATDGSKPFTGEIDEFQILADKDLSGYVPTAQATAGAATKMLCRFDQAFLVDDNINPSADDIPVRDRDPFAGQQGYPAASAFMDQRLMLARTDENPQTVWGSRTGDPYNFGLTGLLKDDDSVTIPIASRQLAEIQHLVPLDTLMAFTSSSYFSISGSGNGPLTPTDIMVRPKGESPCSATVPPLVVGSMVVFANPSRSRVNGLFVAADNGVFQEKDLSILAEHLPRLHPVREWAYQRHPLSSVWCVCDDGTGLVLTVHREHEVYAWGTVETAEGDQLRSVACIPGADQDYVYFAVKRGDAYCVERMEPRLPGGDVSASYFLDCGLDGQFDPAVSTLSAPHLAGRTVGVLADGSYLGTFEADESGDIALPLPVSSAVVGLPYESVLQTLPLSRGGRYESPAAKPQRIGRIGVMLMESRGGRFSTCEDRIPATAPTPEVELSLRTDEAWGEPTRLASGMFELALHGQWQYSSCLVVRQSDPLPLTVNALAIDFTA